MKLQARTFRPRRESRYTTHYTFKVQNSHLRRREREREKERKRERERERETKRESEKEKGKRSEGEDGNKSHSSHHEEKKKPTLFRPHFIHFSLCVNETLDTVDFSLTHLYLLPLSLLPSRANGSTDGSLCEAQESTWNFSSFVPSLGAAHSGCGRVSARGEKRKEEKQSPSYSPCYSLERQVYNWRP